MYFSSPLTHALWLVGRLPGATAAFRATVCHYKSTDAHGTQRSQWRWHTVDGVVDVCLVCAAGASDSLPRAHARARAMQMPMLFFWVAKCVDCWVFSFRVLAWDGTEVRACTVHVRVAVFHGQPLRVCTQTRRTLPPVSLNTTAACRCCTATVSLTASSGYSTIHDGQYVPQASMPAKQAYLVDEPVQWEEPRVDPFQYQHQHQHQQMVAQTSEQYEVQLDSDSGSDDGMTNKKKRPRSENDIKKPLSAYNFYLREANTGTTKNKATIGEVSAFWSKLPPGPKSVYYQRAAIDKQRYVRESLLAREDVQGDAAFSYPDVSKKYPSMIGSFAATIPQRMVAFSCQTENEKWAMHQSQKTPSKSKIAKLKASFASKGYPIMSMSSPQHYAPLNYSTTPRCVHDTLPIVPCACVNALLSATTRRCMLYPGCLHVYTVAVSWLSPRVMVAYTVAAGVLCHCLSCNTVVQYCGEGASTQPVDFVVILNPCNFIHHSIPLLHTT